MFLLLHFMHGVCVCWEEGDHLGEERDRDRRAMGQELRCDTARHQIMGGSFRKFIRANLCIFLFLVFSFLVYYIGNAFLQDSSFPCSWSH